MKGQIITITDLLKEPGYVYQVPDKTRAAMVRISVEDDILVFRTAKYIKSQELPLVIS